MDRSGDSSSWLAKSGSTSTHVNKLATRAFAMLSKLSQDAPLLKEPQGAEGNFVTERGWPRCCAGQWPAVSAAELEESEWNGRDVWPSAPARAEAMSGCISDGVASAMPPAEGGNSGIEDSSTGWLASSSGSWPAEGSLPADSARTAESS